MKRIIHHIASWLVGLNDRKDKINQDLTAFMKRGNNGLIVGFAVFGVIAVLSSLNLYKDYGKLWLALIPIGLLVTFFFAILVLGAYKEKTRYRNRSSRMKLVSFNMDFNERILRRIYGSLTKYEYLDENLSSFQDFYNVLVLNFDEHDSALHFICTQPQLKYILDKFKQHKKGISLKSFERSKKIYHKGNLISAETLSKKYNEFPPDREFEQRIDSFFDFLGDI
ncbi:hypothetical protein [Ulvibacterium marinum]|uniref:Uncharacterized protein n=1 Tax=Ulvibacterium marinum TaxID=2419782 RepID=A0A3B0C0C5_9FLAO|nr:hypothetical protein [Ulvibacterium marinum]RKN77988.1 hypothetical protein D7Z94_22490 [Ulvibacterium marinum]